MIDPITGRCGRISVFQLEGKDGTVHVSGTKMIERVPRGDDGYAALQWLGLRQRQEDVDPRPSFDHFECACVHHLDAYNSVWVHRDGFTTNTGGRKNGLHHYCNECRAHQERERRRMKNDKARWYAKMSA